MKFLNYDSPFMTGLRRGIDYICLGLLWILASVPVITFGAATTAMLQTAEFSIYRQEGSIFVPFWQYFRAEFKQATVLWLIQLPVLAVLVFNFLLVQQQIHPVFRILVGVVSMVFFCWLQLWFGYQSRFQDSIKTVLSNSFRMALGYLGRTFLMAVLTAGAVVGAYLAFVLIPPVLLMVPGIYIMLYTPVLRKLIQKCVPQESFTEENVQNSNSEEDKKVNSCI